MKTGLILAIIALTGGVTAIWCGSGTSELRPKGETPAVELISTDPTESFAGLGVQDPVTGKQDPQPQGLTINRFMERKLDAARNIVSGLALEDYEMIAKNAQDLALLSLESQWNLYQTQPYIFMSDEFRGGSQRLRDAANAQNLDGATLAYFEVTLSCVRCHKYIRQNPGE